MGDSPQIRTSCPSETQNKSVTHERANGSHHEVHSFPHRTGLTGPHLLARLPLGPLVDSASDIFLAGA